MTYQIRPGWHRPIEIYTDETTAALRWIQVRDTADAGFWTINDTDGIRWGTAEAFEREGPGHFRAWCVECRRFFWTSSLRDGCCPGCLIAVRPTEPADTYHPYQTADCLTRDEE